MKNKIIDIRDNFIVESRQARFSFQKSQGITEGGDGGGGERTTKERTKTLPASCRT